jgi:FOG: EAL domain
MTAIRLAVAALDELDTDLTLAVNASPETCCSPELRELVESVEAERLVLEITEHAPVADYGRLLAALAPLRERGVQLAIDDTCSGYASLRHVLHLRPDTIKLDITLTRGIETDPARRALVEAIVGFAPSVGAEVLAEGIETVQHLHALTMSGVALGLGVLPGAGRPRCRRRERGDEGDRGREPATTP